VGIGWDIHRLVPGRRLVLGGVDIPHPKGLLGHSDGDALLHALTDAVLGAAGLGDIGDRFPPTDPRWGDADSGVFLKDALAAARARGLVPVNVDAVVVTEEPRLGPLKREMAARIAALFGLPGRSVCVKAKSAEGLGPVGAGEAIEATAVVLLGMPGKKTPKGMAAAAAAAAAGPGPDRPRARERKR